MMCREVRDRLMAYADDELGVEAALGVEAHVALCTPCRALLHRQRALRHAVGELYRRQPIPEALEGAVLGGLRPRSRWLRLPRLAALAASVALVAGLAALRWQQASSLPPEVGAALRVHAAGERGETPLALASSDLPEVNRWLGRELPFFSPLPEGQAGALRLAGASSLRLGEEQAGYVRYRRGSELVSLFVLPPRRWPAIGRAIHFGGVDFREVEAGGHRVIAWTHEPVSYLLVSRVDQSATEACAICHQGAAAEALAGFVEAERS